MGNKFTNLIELRDINKHFGKVVALKNVNFTVGMNEVIGLIGDNGAGKSTLIKILTGLFPPSSGEIYIRGEKISLRKYSVKVAHKLGVETVFQEKSLGEKQSIFNNIFVGRHILGPLGFIRISKEKEETEIIMKELIGFKGKGVSADSQVSKLSGGERQGVAIGRAMYFEADLIILDEPTAALSLKEKEKVLNFIKQIKKNGKSCIIISHNISEIFNLSDRFVFIDRGELVGEYKKSETSLEEVTEKLLKISK